jgi:hypothetical protein
MAFGFTIAQSVWPPMNADKRGWEAQMLSALIGVHRRPELGFTGG